MSIGSIYVSVNTLRTNPDEHVRGGYKCAHRVFSGDDMVFHPQKKVKNLKSIKIYLLGVAVANRK